MEKQVLRIGKISSVNLERGTAQVTYEDRDSSTTNNFPFLAWTCWRPKVGETVLVGHLTNGSATAVIIGPSWHEGCRPADIGTRELKAQHIEFDAFGDGIKTDIPELYYER